MSLFSENLSRTQRSVLAETKLQADRYGSDLETVRIGAGWSGSMYLFERRARGWRTGIHEGMLILDPPYSFANLYAQREALIEVLGQRSVVALRVFATNLDENQPTGDPLGSWITSANVREIMPLASDYQKFLRQLGKHTRRNIQQCRKWALAKAISVKEGPLYPADVSSLAFHNMPTPKQPHRIFQNIGFCSKQSQPFQLSLIDDRKVPFSTTGGFIEDDIAFMIYQANDHRYRQLNPSLMLRAFLIEKLIDRGIKYLAFVGGCAGVLLHNCEVITVGEGLLVRKTILSRLKYHSVAALTDATHRASRLKPRFV